MKRIALLSLLLAGCALASGYDPKRYPPAPSSAPDPETEPLPNESGHTIPDPKKPPKAPAKPAAPAPAPAEPTDAGK